MRAFLGQVSGGQISDDAFIGQAQTDPGKGATYALLALGNSLVTQADNMKSDLPACQDDFCIDAPGFSAVEGDCRDACRHVLPQFECSRNVIHTLGRQIRQSKNKNRTRWHKSTFP